MSEQLITQNFTRDPNGMIINTMVSFHIASDFNLPLARTCSSRCGYLLGSTAVKKCFSVDLSDLKVPENLSPLDNLTIGHDFRDKVKMYFRNFRRPDLFYEVYPLIMTYSDILSELDIIIFLICYCYRTKFFSMTGEFEYNCYQKINFFRRVLRDKTFGAQESLIMSLRWWTDIRLEERCLYNLVYRILDEVIRCYMKINISGSKFQQLLLRVLFDIF